MKKDFNIKTATDKEVISSVRKREKELGIA